MPSDRARVSHDPSRQYRSVVAQQGRVTLEADVNEAQAIAGEQLRADALDIVGPQGTPDNGYEVTSKAGGHQQFDFNVGAGTMYIGGVRAVLDSAVEYGNQSEWLDNVNDPLWVSPTDLPTSHQQGEQIFVLLREQEVSAVEDSALREVALGGPDSAARTRLVQRIVRLPVAEKTCEEAQKNGEAAWRGRGVQLNPRTLRLEAPIKLKAEYIEPPPPDNQCDPVAHGGFLGADNQLIRVQITSYDAQARQGRFVWGFNNASFLYRANAVDAQTLQLETSPVDGYHAPRANAAVEVLRSAVALGGGDYIAAHSGVVLTPTQAFVPETRRLALPAALPAEYVDATQARPLFLRLWEAEVAFSDGTPVELAATGIRVTLNGSKPSGALSIGQFWTFAVRPSTPTAIYPQRYLDAAQPPDGPRLWACPLAILSWTQRVFQRLDDCRPQFDNLVELTRRPSDCCGVVVKPSQIGTTATLQRILDDAAERNRVVYLEPGTYELDEPLKLGSKHSHLVIEGCRDGAVIVARKGSEKNFALGLVILNRANDVTLRRLRFHLPLAPQAATSAGAAGFVSIGVRPIHCADLVIEECLFRFELAPDASVSAVAVYAGSEMWNARFERNRFLHDEQYEQDARVHRVLMGIALLPQSARTRDGDQPLLPSVIDRAVIRDNEFAGLTHAIAVMARLGRVRCTDNFVHDCASGILLSDLTLSLAGEVLHQSFRLKFEDAAQAALHEALQNLTQPEMAALALQLARALPLPPEFAPAEKTTLHEQIHPDELKTLRAAGRELYVSLLDSYRGQTSAPKSGKKAAAKPEAHEAHEAHEASEAVAEAAPALGKSAGFEIFGTNLFHLRALAAPAVRKQSFTFIQISGNEVVLDRAKPPQAANADAAAAQRPIALSVRIDAEDQGTLIVSANRCVVSAALGVAAALQTPARAVVQGNLFANESDQPRAQAFVLHGVLKGGLFSIAGNAFVGTTQIVPARQTSTEPTSWDFLNSRL
jgi:hypothetical protein